MLKKIIFIIFVMCVSFSSIVFGADYESSEISNYSFDDILNNSLDYISMCLNESYKISGIDYEYYTLGYNPDTDSWYFVASDNLMYKSTNTSLALKGNFAFVTKKADSYIFRIGSFRNSGSYYGFECGTTFVYSSFDVYDDVNYTGNLVFQHPLLYLEEIVEEQIIQAIPILKEQVAQTLAEIVPVAIVILATIVVIFLMLCRIW